MAQIDPHEPIPSEDSDDAVASLEHDPAAVARSLATVDGRSSDRAYTDYVTAVNEVTSPALDVQVEGIARLGRLIVHPEHGEAAIAILRSFAAEAEGQPDGPFSPSAALLAKEILAFRPKPETLSDRTCAAPAPRHDRSTYDPAAARPRPRRLWLTWAAAMAGRALTDHRAVWGVALAAAVAAGLGNLAYAGVLGLLAGRALPGAAGMSLVVAVSGGMVALVLLRSAGIYTVRVLTERMQIRLAAQDRRDAVHAYLRRPQLWSDRGSLDQAMAVVRGDGERTWYAAASLPFVLGTAIAAVAGVAVVVRVDWVAGAAAGLVLAALVVVTLLYLSRLTEPSRRASEHASEVRTAAADCVDAAAAVDSIGAVTHGGTHLVVAAAALRDTRVRLEVVRARYEVLLDLAPVTGILLAVPLVAVRPAGGAAGLAMAAMLVSGMALPVRAGTWLFGELPAGLVRWRYAQRFVRSGDDMRYGERALPAAVVGPGELRFERCGVTDRSGRVVLPRLDLVVPDGSLVAVAGATADEAATITALAARQLDPTAGAVTLAGADLRELTRDSLAGRVGRVAGDGRPPAVAGPRLLVADDAQQTGATTVADELAAAVRSAPAVSALVVTNRRAVLAEADEVVYLHGGRAVARGPHDWLLENVPGYAGLIIGFDGEEGESVCPDAAECGGDALDEATERYHAADRLAAQAASPRSFAVLRRNGNTCHAHRTTGGPYQPGRRRPEAVAEDATAPETQEAHDVQRLGVAR